MPKRFAFSSAVVVAAVLVAGALLGPIARAAATTIPGGVFVTCHDPDFHAVKGVNLAGAQNLIKRAVSYVTFGKLNPKVLLVTGQIPASDVGSHSDPRLAIPASGFSTYDVASAFPSSLAPPPLPLSTVNFASYDVIVVASDFGGWLSQRELNILISRQQDIFNFINAGGGVVALAEKPQWAPLAHDRSRIWVPSVRPERYRTGPVGNRDHGHTRGNGHGLDERGRQWQRLALHLPGLGGA
jgi:hypothetical protein